MNETADIKSTGAGAINIKVCKLWNKTPANPCHDTSSRT